VRHNARRDHVVDRRLALDREELAQAGHARKRRLLHVRAVHQRWDLRARRQSQAGERGAVGRRVGRRLLRLGERAALEQALLALALAELDALALALLAGVVPVDALLVRVLAIVHGGAHVARGWCVCVCSYFGLAV
jgi:hypothetical protein